MNETAEIVYGVEATLDADEFMDIMHRSGLAERRPVHNRGLIDLTCEAAGLDANMIRVSAPGAMSFYDHIGQESISTGRVPQQRVQPPAR